MKKHLFTIILVALSLLAAVPAQARTTKRVVRHSEDGLSLNVSYATPSSFAAAMFNDGMLFGHDWFCNYDRLGEIYRDYYGPTMSAGTFGLEARWKFNHVVALSLDFSSCLVWHDVFSSVSDEKLCRNTGAVISLAPRLSLFYLDRQRVRLYGSCAFGVAFLPGFTETSDKVMPSIQFVPFGVEYSFDGSPLSAFAEYGFGIEYAGIRAGVGIKF